VLSLAAIAAFVVSFAVARAAFASLAYGRGYRDGQVAPVDHTEMEHEERMSGAEMVWSACGVDPENAGGLGWYVCSFRVVAMDTQSYSETRREAPKILVPSFTVLSRAIVGRWYTPGPSGVIRYVDR
jgi:hypothetical protein